jgi:ABC-type phosphate transport system substrate-binding protein
MIAKAEGVVVIVNRSNNAAVDKELVTNIYLGKKSYWQNGALVMALARSEGDPTYLEFCKKILGRSPIVVKTIWAQKIFTGRGMPPKVTEPDAEVKKLVSENVNAIGYIDANSLDDSVKAVLR